MSAIEREFQRRLAKIQRGGEIHCPFCDALFVDEECSHISYHSDQGAKPAMCGTCEQEFMVEGTVDRTYKTSAIPPRP